ncbi:hypothetical protein CAS74_004936 [Pichia kudriavzevii]|uniref:UDP-N-acetylglucosamine transferase subunit ALG14 n=1 Tax=Pichia kudriavzevii TaxID=4909 RepID=A0A1V2LI42_PICKU|nr:UDP-N-acetylglucosamine transferase subunit ALG14 [Pichia kudriavzevii]OUT20194.1 hypothetical protein CAS74_004936 [Pichia kudriavzevii]
MDENQFTVIVSSILTLILLVLARLISVLPVTKRVNRLNEREHGAFNSNTKAKGKRQMLILLGSGGHTGEMLRVLEQWKQLDKYDREYVISTGDETSIIKLKQFEEQHGSSKNYKITFVYRARNIGEGKFKATVNTLRSFISTISTFLGKNKLPDIFLTNGPGTAIPIAYILFIFKFFGMCRTKIIYMESIARVKDLSLTGWLIMPISDRILVQWERISKKYRRCEYYGMLV